MAAASAAAAATIDAAGAAEAQDCWCSCGVGHGCRCWVWCLRRRDPHSSSSSHRELWCQGGAFLWVVEQQSPSEVHSGAASSTGQCSGSGADWQAWQGVSCAHHGRGTGCTQHLERQGKGYWWRCCSCDSRELAACWQPRWWDSGAFTPAAAARNLRSRGQLLPASEPVCSSC